MRKFFTFLTLWLGLSLAANAQIYTFTGDVDYAGNTALADAFDDAATFTATLVFDTSQVTADAASSYTSPGNYEFGYYNYNSLSFQVGGESWSHDGTYVSDRDYVYIKDDLSESKDDRLLTIGNSDQLTSGGTTVNYAYFQTLSYADIFSGGGADNLLAFNDDGFTYNGGMIDTNLGGIVLSNITMTSAVPEPATWLMMIIGFGIVSAASRKHNKGGNIATA